MNLLESHIKKIHSVTDVTEDFMKHCGYEPKETLFERLNLCMLWCYWKNKEDVLEEWIWESKEGWLLYVIRR